MKTIKAFDYRQLNIYLWDGEKQAIRVRDFLTHDRVGIFSSYHTDSRGSADSPTAVFVEEDPLQQLGCQPCSWFYNSWPMNFILVPVTFNGNDYDVWIPLSKFNSCFSEQEREELARRNPKYFSDKPQKKLGFFNEARIVDGKIKEVTPGDKFKVHGNWPGDMRTRNLDFEITIDNIHMQPGGYQFSWGNTYYTRTTLGTGETITGSMSDDSMLKFLNTPGWVYEYNGKSWPIKKSLGFFNEGINTNFNAEEIIRIMTDTSLSSSDKCKRLFGRNEDYLVHVQWLCFRKSDKWINYLYEHNYFTDDAKERYENDYTTFWNDFAEVIDRGENDRNDSGKRTLFYDWRQAEEVPCDLNTSYDAYVVEHGCNGATVERRVMNWYNHIKFSVSFMEDSGYVIDRSGIKRLGFFNK